MTSLIATNSADAFINAARLKTLGAISCPVLLGSALAVRRDEFSLGIFFMTMTSSLLLQILANFINDYGDFIKGSDACDRLGPPRAMQMGWITKDVMIKGIGVILMLAILCGLPLVMRGGWPILAIGIMGIALCGWYTLGSRPLAYRGFVEIIIFLVFGPFAVIATYYLQTLSIESDALLVGIAPGALATALILTNNLRDIEQDRKNHKLTIAVRLGERFARFAIIGLILLSFIGPLIMVVIMSYSPIVLCSYMALLLPVQYFKMIVFSPISRKFNLMLASIGKSLYLFGIILSIGIIYGAP